MFDALEREDEWDADTDLSMGASGGWFIFKTTPLIFSDREIRTAEADKAMVDNKSKVTEAQIRTFLELCWVKYVKARIEPGIKFPDRRATDHL